MIIFSIICLVVLMLGVQHLLNWGWRNVSDEPTIFGMFILTVLSMMGTWYIILAIITWGKQLPVHL